MILLSIKSLLMISWWKLFLKTLHHNFISYVNILWINTSIFILLNKKLWPWTFFHNITLKDISSHICLYLYLLVIHLFDETDSSHLWIQVEYGLSPCGDKGVHNLSIESLVSIHCLHQGDGGANRSVLWDVKGVENVGEDWGIVVDVGDVDFHCSHSCVGAIWRFNGQSVGGSYFSIQSPGNCKGTCNRNGAIKLWNNFYDTQF